MMMRTLKTSVGLQDCIVNIECNTTPMGMRQSNPELVEELNKVQIPLEFEMHTDENVIEEPEVEEPKDNEVEDQNYDRAAYEPA